MMLSMCRRLRRRSSRRRDPRPRRACRARTGKKPAYVCPNRHTVAHAAAALPLLRELRAVLGRVAATDAGLAAALAIPGRVLHDTTDAVDAAVDRNTRVVGASAADAADACVCAGCWPSYALAAAHRGPP